MEAFVKCLNTVSREEEEHLDAQAMWDWQGLAEEKDIDLRQWLAVDVRTRTSDGEDEQESCRLPLWKQACAFKSEYHFLKAVYARNEAAATTPEEEME